MSYTATESEVTSSNPDTVLSKTFGLVGLSMIPTVIMAYLVSLIPMEFYVQNKFMAIFVFVFTLVLSIGLLFFAMKQKKESAAVAAMMLFAGVMGASLGPIIMTTMQNPNGMKLILSAASLTGMSLFGLTAYAMKTKKDFSFMGGFLFAGLIVLIGGSIMQFFFPSPMMYMLLTVGGVLLFLAYILYDVSKVVTGGQTNFVFAAIAIYLDVINLFVYILRLLTGFSDND